MNKKYLIIGGNSDTGQSLVKKLHAEQSELFITSRSPIENAPGTAQTFEFNILDGPERTVSFKMERRDHTRCHCARRWHHF